MSTRHDGVVEATVLKAVTFVLGVLVAASAAATTPVAPVPPLSSVGRWLVDSF